MTRVHDALFVLSTGRCGTQWLAAALGQCLGDRAVVAHEPLGRDYASREMLGAGDPSALGPDAAAAIRDHVAAIEATLETRPYIECGHPAWSAIPYLVSRFAGRVRVLHLARHPVPTAWSWVTHRAYCPPLVPHLRERVLLSPFDEGIRLTSYRERWPALNPYEKSLFYWAEVNAFGLRVAENSGAPWLRARFEDLVRGDALPRVLEFAGAGATTNPERVGIVDEFRSLTEFWCDPALVARHPDVVATAAALGYDALAFDGARLRQRYSGR